MKKYKWLYALFLVAFLVNACNDKVNDFTEATPKFKVIKTEARFDEKGGSGTIEVDASGIQVETEDTWLKTSVSGTIINLTAEPNTNYQGRSTNVVLKKDGDVQKISITQLGTIDNTELTSFTFPDSGGRKAFLFKTRHQVKVSMSEENKKWLAWKMDKDSIIFTATPYTGISQRTAQVVVSPEGGADTKVSFSQITSYLGTYSFTYTDIDKAERKGFCVITQAENNQYLLKLIPQVKSDFGGLPYILLKMNVTNEGALLLNETQEFYRNGNTVGRYLGLLFFKRFKIFSTNHYFIASPQVLPQGLTFKFKGVGEISGQTMDAILLALGTPDDLYIKHINSLMNIELVKTSNKT